MRILVTGANGQLGMSLRRLAGIATPHPGLDPGSPRFVFTDVTDVPGLETVHLDITDIGAVRALVAEEQVDTIINCAAYTNVDAAEDNPELAELLNATAVGNLATVMKETGGLLVHISTDYVFGGDPYNTPCTEEQKGTPTGVYGLTKLHGEQAILASGVRHIIIRTAWLFSEYGKNFVKTMLRLTAEKPQLKVVFDQVGTPTYAGDLAGAILDILRALDGEGIADQVRNEVPHPGLAVPHPGLAVPHPGLAVPHPGLAAPHPGLDPGSPCIYHYSNEGVCSWYDFTKFIANYSGHTSCDIQPCHSNEFPSKVHRPAYSVLDKTKIKNTFGLQIPYWTESLKRCIQNLNA